MRGGVLAAVIVAFVGHVGVAQSRPNLSGTWSMDRARSESPMYSDTAGPTTLAITQTDSELQMTRTRDGKTATITYRLDGRPSVIPNGTATSHWEGTALVTESVLTIQGQTVTAKETRRLSESGEEMLVDTVLVVQHGYTLAGSQNYGAGRDVFVRSRP